MVRPFQIFNYLLLLLLWALAADAAPRYYNLTVGEGLPSNHIYGILTDRNGYLWIATPDGVVRYNGYNVRVFNTTDGLPTPDIWEIFEDERQRLWLLNFSQSLGYIANDQYHSATILDSTVRILPIPLTISNYREGVGLVTGSSLVLFEKNDTFFTYRPDIVGIPIYRQRVPMGMNMTVLTMDQVQHYYSILEIDFIPGSVNTRRVKLPKQPHFHYLFNDRLILYLPGDPELLVYHLKNKDLSRIMLNKSAQNIKIIPGSTSVLYVLADGVFYQFDDTLGLTDSWDAETKSFPPVSISWIAENDVWGQCMGGMGTGVLIPSSGQNPLNPIRIDLAEHNSIGVGSNGNHYWWNDPRKQLVSLDVKSELVNRKSVSEFDNKAIKVLPFKEDYSLVVVLMDGVYVLHNPTGNLERLFGVKDIVIRNRTDHVTNDGLFRCDDILLKDTTELYLISREYGLVRLDLESGMAHLLMQKEEYIGDGSDYRRLLFDPVTRVIWAYGSKEAIRLVTHSTDHIYPSVQKLRNPFLNGIEQVVFDEKHQNIFVRRMGNVYMVDRRTGIVSLVNRHMNLDRGMISLKDSLLILAGRFGIACYVIEGPGKLSKPAILEQWRDQFYSAVTDLIAADTSVYLFTNNGIFKSPIPFPDGSNVFISNNTRLVAYHQSGVLQVNPGDTLNLQSDALNLGFDLINPAANGIPRFEYHLLETGLKWQKSVSNDIVLPRLKPDRTYTLDVQVRDNANVHSARIYLYIMPAWYQSVWVERLMIVAGVALLALFSLLIIWVTKWYMKRENFRKNLRMEIELKSIYAQINPHFIYNSLNAILLMIKQGNNKEAFYNVSKFSKLLRAYIKSSRNRYITVGEEIDNLSNYIELQQARFGGGFSYKIQVEDPEGDLRERKIPSLLLQPIVENAINHGLFHKENPGSLEITFCCNMENKEILCIIEDDGIGRKAAAEIKRRSSLKTESYGAALVGDLISILNRYEQGGIRIEYIDKQEPLTGTIVKLYIK